VLVSRLRERGTDVVALTEIRYLYRDCGNYKVDGSVHFLGRLTREQSKILAQKVAPERQFIAEQIGFPVLYPQLWRWTNGPSGDDVVWHELASISEGYLADLTPKSIMLGRVESFYERMCVIDCWDETQSCHFGLEDGSTLKIELMRATGLAH
jgi:hypothetical protein